MSEFRRPQPEEPWLEAARTLHAFKEGIDSLFINHFDAVDRGMIRDGRLPEQLVIKGEKKDGKDAPSFTLVRGLYKNPDFPIDYGLHIKEKGTDYLYRIKHGIVHKLSPTSDEMAYLDIDIHNFAAGNDPEELNDQPVSFGDIDKTLERANEAKPLEITFKDIVNNYQSYDDSMVESDEEIEDQFNFEDGMYPLDSKETEYAALAADYFNWSIDEIMNEKADAVKKYDHIEEFEMNLPERDGVLSINITRGPYEDSINRVVSMAHTKTSMATTYVVFTAEDGLLQGSKMSDDHEDESNVLHADLDPNAARNLIKFIKTKIKPEEK